MVRFKLNTLRECPPRKKAEAGVGLWQTCLRGWKRVLISAVVLCTQERKEEGAKAEAGKGDAEEPVEAQDLTVFVQSVMEQMVRKNRWELEHAKIEGAEEGGRERLVPQAKRPTI